MTEIHAFQCFPKGRPEWARIVNAPTASKARYEYWLDVSDPWPDVKLLDIRSRKVGGPHTSDDFLRNAAYRGMPDVRCGDPVRVGDSEGAIVGHNSNANFDVLFSTGSYAGQKLSVHPQEMTRLPREGA